MNRRSLAPFAQLPRPKIPRPRTSSLEARFDLIWLATRPPGLPLPVAEYQFTPPRKWRFDRAFVCGKQLLDCQTGKSVWAIHAQGGVAVELEGGLHSRGRHVRAGGFQADCAKYNAAAVAGWLVLRFTAKDLGNPKFVVDTVAAALRLRGVVG